MRDFSLFLLRATVGGLLAGHGAQKLFGSFDGPGPEGAGESMERLGLKPGRRWAMLAGLAEFGGGSLTAMGFLSPLGPMASIASMFMAATTAHWGKPIWVTSGGAELPVTNMAVLGSLALAGPGRISMDQLFGIRVPWWMTALMILGTAGGIGAAHISRQSMVGARRQSTPEPESATNAQADMLEPTALPKAA